MKTTSSYTWSKREVTEQGSPLTDLIDLGLNRAKYATGCVDALLSELKKKAVNKEYALLTRQRNFRNRITKISDCRCRVLVVIDGFNSFFSPRSRVIREDKSCVLPAEFVLTDAFLSLTKNDWVNYCTIAS